jgi:hypothetical protein
MPYPHNCSNIILNSDVVSLSSNPTIISNEILITIAFKSFTSYLSNISCIVNWNDTNNVYECVFWDR